jgi:hypothetical protein
MLPNKFWPVTESFGIRASWTSQARVGPKTLLTVSEAAAQGAESPEFYCPGIVVVNFVAA